MAVAITALLFEAALGGSLWLVNHASFWAVVHARAFASIVIVFDSMFVPMFVMMFVIPTARRKREDEKIERLTPLKRQPLKNPPAF